MKFELEGNIITAQRVFCIGCNYAEHVRELHGFEEIPPVIFMKPAASLTPADEVLSPPPGYKGAFDYETNW